MKVSSFSFQIVICFPSIIWSGQSLKAFPSGCALSFFLVGSKGLASVFSVFSSRNSQRTGISKSLVFWAAMLFNCLGNKTEKKLGIFWRKWHRLWLINTSWHAKFTCLRASDSHLECYYHFDFIEWDSWTYIISSQKILMF